MDELQQAAFENSLRRQHRNRRLILGGIAILFLILFAVFYSLYEASAHLVQVSAHYEYIAYDRQYVPFAATTFSVGLTTAFLLLFDFAYCRFRSAEKLGQILTVNRRAFSVSIYVDGKEVARRGPFTLSHVANVWLNSKVRATVSLSNTVWYLAHISYSDFSTSVEI